MKVDNEPKEKPFKGKRPVREDGRPREYNRAESVRRAMGDDSKDKPRMQRVRRTE
jgi:hypothetical protein